MKKFLVYAAVGLGVVAYNVATEADRDATGAIVSGGNVDAFQMRVGDCFDDTAELGMEILALGNTVHVLAHQGQALPAWRSLDGTDADIQRCDDSIVLITGLMAGVETLTRRCVVSAEVTAPQEDNRHQSQCHEDTQGPDHTASIHRKPLGGCYSAAVCFPCQPRGILGSMRPFN